MAQPKITRLENEYKEMLDLKQKSSLISFSVQGTPPTRYDVQLSCYGLTIESHEVIRSLGHQFQIILDKEFPAIAPKVIWQSPIFHPNFRVPYVCLGDHWYPGWSISEMCVVLCEMVQFKVFNIYDPLNMGAAEWLRGMLDEDASRFPVDPRPVRDLDFEINCCRPALED